MSKLYRIIRR